MISSTGDESDSAVLNRQLGLSPRGNISVCLRCSFGFPAVIRTMPGEDGFFTASIYWLTCPALKKAISRIENAGGLKAVERMMGKNGFRSGYLEALKKYHENAEKIFGNERLKELLEIGVDGCRNPLKVKCLHAQTAHFLAGFLNPVGEWVVKKLEIWECDDGRCSEK